MIIRRGIYYLAAFVVIVPGALGGSAGSNWRSFGTADGLAEAACDTVSIGPAPRGKLWARNLSSGSLNGSEGYAFTNLAAPGPVMGRIYERAAGRQLWMVAEEGLREYREDKWTVYPVPAIASILRERTLRTPDPVPLCPIRLSRVLFLLPDGLMQFDVGNPEPLTIYTAASSKLESFTGMTTGDYDGKLWIAGKRGLAHASEIARTIKPETAWQEFFPPASLRLENFRRPVEDDEGGVTAVADSTDGSQKFIVHFDGRDWFAYPMRQENIIMAWRGPEKGLWAATSNALFQLDPAQKELIACDEITPRNFYDVAVEPSGTFWLATSEGLFHYSPPTWQTPSPARNLVFPIQAAAGEVRGKVWIASPNVLQCIDNDQLRRFPFPAAISRELPVTRGLFPLANGSVVLDAADHFVSFDPGDGSFTPISAPPKSRTKPIGLLRDGSLCVEVLSLASTNDSPTLQVFDGNRLNPFPYATPPSNLGNDLVLLASQGGNLWLAGPKGVARYRENSWQRFGPADENSPDGFSCLLEIGEEKIWCGARDKIWECDGKSWRVVWGGFERINSLLKARDGSIWVASDNGLHRFYHGAWAVNGPEEGVPGGAAWLTFEDSRGRIWNASSQGLSLYHPEADPDPPQTYASIPDHADNSIPEGSPVVINFSGMDRWKFTAADRLLYSYRLDEKDWFYYQDIKSISLSDLSPGKHFFQVQSMDRNWNLDPKPFLVEFAVVLPWYKESRLMLISSAGILVALFFAALAFNRHYRLLRAYAEVEGQVALRTTQLAKANQELLNSQKMLALGTLAAGIAHDFNNILSIIKGSAQIIEDNLENQEKIRTRTSRIKTVVEQGSGIVKAMLGFSRGSGSELTLCDVNAVVSETIQLLGDRFLREVDVQFDPTPGIPEVPASKDFIQQILLNLIFNAAEAMTERRQVVLRTARIEHIPAGLVLAPKQAPAYVLVSVKDFGCGISPEIMPRIFEPFFTTKSLSARRGTGLGLSMVYELARQMESGLAAESTLNQGSLFTLVIPVRDLPMDSAEKRD
jgi:signal transduction histidine kinase